MLLDLTSNYSFCRGLKVNLFRFTDQVLRRPIVAYRGLKFNRPPAYDFKRVSKPSLAGKACSHNWLSTPRKPIISVSKATPLTAVMDGRRGRVAKGHSCIWLSAHRKPIIPVSKASPLPAVVGGQAIQLFRLRVFLL